MSLDNLLTHPSLAGMRAVPQWIAYRLVDSGKRPGKKDKIPLHHATGSPTAVNDRASWTDVHTAAASVRAWGVGFGLGFCFTADCGYWFVDLDSCAMPDGTWSPLAQQMVQVLDGAAVEVSSSGKGLHLFGAGTVPLHACRNLDHHAELYTEDRYAALSGISLQGDCNTDCTAGISWVAQTYFPPRVAVAANVPNEGPRPGWNGPRDNGDLIRRALMSRSAAGVFGSRASFSDLWHNEERALSRAYPPDASSQEPYDRSSADAALASHLAWWSGCDAERMESLMRESGLARDKYDRPDYLPRTIANACSNQREVLQDRALSTAAEINGTFFLAAGLGPIPGTIEKVHDTLVSAESGIRLGQDDFQDQVMIDDGAGKWRRFDDADYGRLRAQFGRRGFRPVTAEIMRTAVMLAAGANRFDSAIDWAASLQWDGRPRIDTALSSYFGCADTPYARAVGRYLFTALAGRALVPGCQADMVPVLVGMQGARKTSAVRALCPDPEFFVEINLKKIDDDNLSRNPRGKLVGELAELRGLVGRDRESVKAWVTRRVERWRPLYREFDITYPRRLVLIGTTNEPEFLDDATGERRWLPVEAGRVEVEAVERDREQLWAEGVAVFKASGIAWQDAERLAEAEHAKHKVIDPWADPVEAWIATPAAQGGPPAPHGPFRIESACLGALKRPIGSMAHGEALRLGKLLRGLGYQKTTARLDGRACKVWARDSRQ